MPTKRNNGSKAQEFRRLFTTYLIDFSTTVSLIKPTRTKDSMDRVTASSSATTTIRADIQWVTKQDIDHLNMGNVQVGDGMLFVEYDADIALQDEVEFGTGERWKVDSQIEGEQLAGEVVYKGFILKRNLQS